MKNIVGRLSIRFQFSALMIIFIGVVLVAGTIIGNSIVVSQTVNESRSQADMVEHIGKWASQYGGVHVKRKAGDTTGVGSALESHSYAASEEDIALLAGLTVEGGRVARNEELGALRRTETYHWKNPALIQREVSDIAAMSSSNAKFRMTARTVLNPNNAPTAFEREALEAIDKKFSDETDAQKRERTEFWKVEDGQVRYARAIVAQKSCLKCHGTFDSSPAFLKTNRQFNGGGGFGYIEGKPAGIISVAIPLPTAGKALSSSMTTAGWQALAAIGVMGLVIMVFIGRRVISPMNQLRQYAQALSSAELSEDYQVPEMVSVRGSTRNEVHLLAASIHDLGQALKIVYRRTRSNRAGDAQ